MSRGTCKNSPCRYKGSVIYSKAAVKGHMAAASESREGRNLGKRFVYYCIRGNFLIPFVCIYKSQFCMQMSALCCTSVQFAGPLHQALHFSLVLAAPLLPSQPRSKRLKVLWLRLFTARYKRHLHLDHKFSLVVPSLTAQRKQSGCQWNCKQGNRVTGQQISTRKQFYPIVMG